MSDETPKPKPETIVPDDATPHNPGLTPPGNPNGDKNMPNPAPYEKKPDPARQPS